MNTESKRPPNLPETKFIGEIQEFSSEVFTADDPRLEPRVRKGRPADRLRGPYDEPDGNSQAQ